MSEQKKNKTSVPSEKPTYTPPIIKCISSKLTKNKQLEINACNSGFGSGPTQPDKSDNDSDSVTY